MFSPTKTNGLQRERSRGLNTAIKIENNVSHRAVVVECTTANEIKSGKCCSGTQLVNICITGQLMVLLSEVIVLISAVDLSVSETRFSDLLVMLKSIHLAR